MLSFIAQASDLRQRETDLKHIQSQINQQEKSIQNTNKQRSKLQKLLKKDELAIATIAKKLNSTQEKLSDIDKDLIQIKQKQKQLQEQKLTQQKILSKQIASAYINGDHDYTKMLLNQQNPAVIERNIVYYQYLNKARTNAIENLKITEKKLSDLSQKELQRKTALTELVSTQKHQVNSLNQEQIQRERTLKQLNRTLTSKSEQIEQLQIEEASIKELIKRALAESKNTFKMDGLARKREKLAWPTKGKLIDYFGTNRAGGVKWKGVLISAPEGEIIKSIAAGKVIYADWLRGFGMVIVIDHGKGYMSLYGHAQALLKTVGDKIKAGESIALVGRSGGQLNPSLYFEIRHKGQAINPAMYCR